MLASINSDEAVTLRDMLERDCKMGSVAVRDLTYCASRKGSGERCSLCAELCPAGRYQSPEDGKSAQDCLRCGVCAAACPDRCINPAVSRAEHFLSALARDQQMEISCRSDDQILSYTVDCIAGLSWEQLALAALKNGLVLSMSACRNCSDTIRAARIEQTLKELQFFLGDTLFSQRVTVLRGQKAVLTEGAAMSRRELLQGMRRNAALPDALMLPERKESRTWGLVYRELLRDQTAAFSAGQEERPKYRLRLPEFTENCYSCGSCVQACPRGALSFREQGDSTLAVIEPWRCTGCGLCMRACRSGGIRKIAPMRVPTLEKVVLRKLDVPKCTECEKKRSPDAKDGLCPICRSRKANERLRR